MNMLVLEKFEKAKEKNVKESWRYKHFLNQKVKLPLIVYLV